MPHIKLDLGVLFHLLFLLILFLRTLAVIQAFSAVVMETTRTVACRQTKSTLVFIAIGAPPSAIIAYQTTAPSTIATSSTVITAGCGFTTDSAITSFTETRTIFTCIRSPAALYALQHTVLNAERFAAFLALLQVAG